MELKEVPFHKDTGWGKKLSKKAAGREGLILRFGRGGGPFGGKTRNLPNYVEGGGGEAF